MIWIISSHGLPNAIEFAAQSIDVKGPLIGMESVCTLPTFQACHHAAAKWLADGET